MGNLDKITTYLRDNQISLDNLTPTMAHNVLSENESIAINEWKNLGPEALKNLDQLDDGRYNPILKRGDKAMVIRFHPAQYGRGTKGLPLGHYGWVDGMEARKALDFVELEVITDHSDHRTKPIPEYGPGWSKETIEWQSQQEPTINNTYVLYAKVMVTDPENKFYKAEFRLDPEYVTWVKVEDDIDKEIYHDIELDEDLVNWSYNGDEIGVIKETLEEKNKDNIDRMKSDNIRNMTMIPTSKRLASEVIYGVLTSHGYGPYSPGDTINLEQETLNGPDGYDFENRLRFDILRESLKLDKEGRGFSFEGIIAGFFGGKPAQPGLKEDIYIDGVPVSVKQSNAIQNGTADAWDTGSLLGKELDGDIVSGYNLVKRQIESAGLEVPTELDETTGETKYGGKVKRNLSSFETPYALLVAGKEYDVYKRNMLETVFTSSKGVPLYWIFAGIKENGDIKYRYMSSEQLIDNILNVANIHEVIGLGRNRENGFRIKSKPILTQESTSEIILPVVTEKELIDETYEEEGEKLIDRIANLFGDKASRVNRKAINYIKDNPSDFLERLKVLMPELQKLTRDDVNEATQRVNMLIIESLSQSNILKENKMKQRLHWWWDNEGFTLDLDMLKLMGISSDDYPQVRMVAMEYLGGLEGLMEKLYDSFAGGTEKTIYDEYSLEYVLDDMELYLGGRGEPFVDVDVSVDPSTKINIMVDEDTGEYVTRTLADLAWYPTGTVNPTDTLASSDNLEPEITDDHADEIYEDMQHVIIGDLEEKYFNKYMVDIGGIHIELGKGDSQTDSMPTIKQGRRGSFDTFYKYPEGEGQSEGFSFDEVRAHLHEDSDIFGQGLLEPIEYGEYDNDEDWEKDVRGVDVDDEGEPLPTKRETSPEDMYVSPTKDLAANICNTEGFCSDQGPITFGQLKSLIETATHKRLGSDIARGGFKTIWRLVPFFLPQLLLVSAGVTITRAINKIITPALKDTRGHKSWWGKAVLKAMDIAEGDYIPDKTLGDDPLSKIFFISDGLLTMLKDKYKLKFARYVAAVAASKPDNEIVPEWFVDDLLRDYLNQKFLLDPPLQTRAEFKKNHIIEGYRDKDNMLDVMSDLYNIEYLHLNKYDLEDIITSIKFTEVTHHEDDGSISNPEQNLFINFDVYTDIEHFNNFSSNSIVGWEDIDFEFGNKFTDGLFSEFSENIIYDVFGIVKGKTIIGMTPTIWTKGNKSDNIIKESEIDRPKQNPEVDAGDTIMFTYIHPNFKELDGIQTMEPYVVEEQTLMMKDKHTASNIEKFIDHVRFIVKKERQPNSGRFAVGKYEISRLSYSVPDGTPTKWVNPLYLRWVKLDEETAKHLRESDEDASFISSPEDVVNNSVLSNIITQNKYELLKIVLDNTLSEPSVFEFKDVLRKFLKIGNIQTQGILWLFLRWNTTREGQEYDTQILETLKNVEYKDLQVPPSFYRTDVYYADEVRNEDADEWCDEDGYGEETGNQCECEEWETIVVLDEDGEEIRVSCDDAFDYLTQKQLDSIDFNVEDCECIEYQTQWYTVETQNTYSATFLSTDTDNVPVTNEYNEYASNERWFEPTFGEPQYLKEKGFWEIQRDDSGTSDEWDGSTEDEEITEIITNEFHLTGPMGALNENSEARWVIVESDGSYPFSRKDITIMKMIHDEFDLETIRNLANITNSYGLGDAPKQYKQILKIFGELKASTGWDNEDNKQGSRFAKWVSDNWNEEGDYGNLTDPERAELKWYRGTLNTSGEQVEYRSGEIDVLGWDEEDATDEISDNFYDWGGEQESYDYGDYNEYDSEVEDVHLIDESVKRILEKKIRGNEEMVVGDRVMLINMDDPWGITPYTNGTVTEVFPNDPATSPNLSGQDTKTSYMVSWDDEEGRTLKILGGIDRWMKIDSDELENINENFVIDKDAGLSPDLKEGDNIIIVRNGTGVQIPLYTELEVKKQQTVEDLNYPDFNSEMLYVTDKTIYDSGGVGSVFLALTKHGNSHLLGQKERWRRDKISWLKVNKDDTVLNEHLTTKDGYNDTDVQTIVDRVYPHIVEDLGPSDYVNEPPTVELWNDIYARLSGIPEMRGEASSTSKSEHDDYGNMIYIYYLNMKNVGDVIKALLHEYTHSLQDPTKKEENRALGYENDPNEIESRAAELNWEEYLQYVEGNLQEHEEPKKSRLNPQLMIGDEILVVSSKGIHDFGSPELYRPYVVVGIKYSHERELYNWTHGEEMSGMEKIGSGKDYDIPFYQIEPVGMTDEERTGAILAGGGRMKPLYIFFPEDRHSGSDQWILRPGFRRGELNEEDGYIDDMVYRDEPMDKHVRKMAKDLGSLEGFPIEEFKNVPPPTNESNKTEEEIGYLEDIPVDKNLVDSADAMSNHFSKFLSTKGLDYPKEELRPVMRGVKAIILKLKYHYNRPRPWQIAKEKGLELNSETLKSSSSPSYPSGHATQGRFVARYLADLYPEYRDELTQMGEDIAFSRNMAKVHYPSDSKFGKLLGDSMYDYVYQPQEELEMELDEYCPMGRPNKCELVKEDNDSTDENTKLNPELEVGDVIMVIKVDGEREDMPNKWENYVVIPKVKEKPFRQAWYEIISTIDDEKNKESGYLPNTHQIKRIYADDDWGDKWIRSWKEEIPKYIKEHKESTLNPELEIGDEIIVVHLTKNHYNFDITWPELYKPYVVVKIKHPNKYQPSNAQTYYELIPAHTEGIDYSFEKGETTVTGIDLRGTGVKRVYPTDKWILNPGFLNEHKESRLSPELEVGDDIIVIDIDREVESNTIKYNVPPISYRPERYIPYTVVEKKTSDYTGTSGGSSEWPFNYTLIETDKYEDYLSGNYMISKDSAKLLFPWIYKWISADIPMATNVDRLTISEHKESRLNPKLKVGDEIMVVKAGNAAPNKQTIPDTYIRYFVTKVYHGDEWHTHPYSQKYYGLNRADVDVPEPERPGVGEGDVHKYLFPDTDKWIFNPEAPTIDYKDAFQFNEQFDVKKSYDNRINKDLEVGDTIIIVKVDKERENGETQYTTPPPELRPKTYTPYDVVKKKTSGGKAKWPWNYVLVPEGEIEITGRNPYGEENNNAKLLYPWVYQWISLPKEGNENLNEHQETQLNPELKVGDIVKVISVDGEHGRMPELFTDYKVVKTRDGTMDTLTHEYYDIVPYPEVELSDVLSLSDTIKMPARKTLYRGDRWIRSWKEEIPKYIQEHNFGHGLSDTKHSPELEVDDVIMVIKTEGGPYSFSAEIGVEYKVIEIGGSQVSDDVSGSKANYRKYYELVPTDVNCEGLMKCDYQSKIKRIYQGDDRWVKLHKEGNENLNEHKETQLNPELEVDDIIKVINIGNDHARMPERFTDYKVYDIRQDNATQTIYYALLPHPQIALLDVTPETDNYVWLQHTFLYPEDTWIRSWKEHLPEYIEEQKSFMDNSDQAMERARKEALRRGLLNSLDMLFDVLPYEEGEIVHNDVNMGIYHKETGEFVPIDYVYDPIMENMGMEVTEADLQLFIDIITEWVNMSMVPDSEEEYVN